MEATPFMKHRVLDKMIENYNIDPHLTTDWNVHTSYGTQHLLKNQIDWDFMNQYYMAVIHDFMIEFFGESINFKVDENPWYTVYGMGQNGPVHDHIDADFSMIHYLKFDPSIHKGTTFINPNRVTMRYHSYFRKDFDKKLNKRNPKQSYYFEEFMPLVGEGDVVIFPSALEHRIDNSNTEELRVVVALNFKVIN